MSPLMLITILNKNILCTLQPTKNYKSNISNIKIMESNKISDKKAFIPLKKKQHLEDELRPEFVEKMKKRQKESTVKIKDFKKHFDLD